MKKKICIALIALMSTQLMAQKKPDKIFHYSSMDAMRNGVYAGSVTVEKLLEKNDFGLGTYHLLDGELIALEGTFYRVATDGTIEKANNGRTIPFGSFTFFKKDHSIKLKNVKNMDELQKNIIDKLPSKNRFYAVRIETEFHSIVLGGAEKVKADDTTGIATFMKTRPLYKKENAKGTLVGFYNPSYIGGLDLAPFHFHFISSDKTFGGHLVDGIFLSERITVDVDQKNAYEVVLPDEDSGYQRQWKTSQTQSSY